VIRRWLRHGSPPGSALALGRGLAVALWAGMGFLAAHNAMNHLWGVEPVVHEAGAV
jgi:uncharacterized BrkB/YihY/UPF0761 family membrane protein